MQMSALDTFTPLFHPSSIAVIGASATSVAAGNRFMRQLKGFGYRGRIVPVHPSADEIEGLPALPSVAALLEPVDYAYVAVGAAQVPALIRSCAGRVRIAQVMSSGFGETDGGRELQNELIAASREAGVRVVGPNCLGVYSPASRLTFTERTSPEVGSIGIVCQSGGLGIDIIRRGQNRGLRYSALVTVGNCADVQPHELLEYFMQSDQTEAIGLYLESAGNGRQLFEVLRAAGSRKPVVILKGGSTRQGQRAVASHTGALASSDRGWQALSAQTGAVLVDNLDAFLDALLMFQTLALRASTTRRIALFGNGGGTSVLGTDAMARAGLDVAPLGPNTIARLEALKLPAGSSVLNPIDVPAGALQQNEGKVAREIVETLAASGDADALVMHINMTVVLSFRHVDMLGNLIDAVLGVKSQGSTMHTLLVLRSDGDPDVEERKRDYRQKAVMHGIPVFDELVPAARALSCLRHVEAFRARSAGGSVKA